MGEVTKLPDPPADPIEPNRTPADDPPPPDPETEKAAATSEVASAVGAEDAAPKRRGRPPGSKNRSRRQEGENVPLDPKLAEKLHASIVQLALIVGVFNEADGQVIAQNADGLADGWANLAAHNPRVRRSLDRIMSGGAWGAALAPTAAVAFGIAANHGMIRVGFLGLGGDVPMPETPVPDQGDARQADRERYGYSTGPGFVAAGGSAVR